MITVNVSTGKGMNEHTAVVQVYGYNRLTPRAARAALQIAGFYTGEAWWTSKPRPEVWNVSPRYGDECQATVNDIVQLCGENDWEVPDLIETIEEDKHGQLITVWIDRTTRERILEERWPDNPDDIWATTETRGYRVYPRSARKLYPR